MDDLSPAVEQLVAERSERGVLWQLLGCFGCLGIVLVVLGLLAATMLRADRDTQTDPASAERNLQTIVSCKIPEGYRGFRGIARDGRRIVLVTPHTHSGLEVPTQGRLTLSVWTFSGAPQAKEVRDYWEGKLREQWGLEDLAPSGEEATTVTVRGKEQPATLLRYRGKGPEPEETRLVLFETERGGAHPERIVVAGIGAESRFDQAAWSAFLESIQ